MIEIRKTEIAELGILMELLNRESASCAKAET